LLLFASTGLTNCNNEDKTKGLQASEIFAVALELYDEIKTVLFIKS